ncbi:uncharacterized protein LOC127087693 isoform X2 [Lathyrus oleraceus]|uniref:Bromo domain-containing protein n=1 Tax=Pisum sativum TaxID=3888 RepID=A0A9D5AEG0_PEA|nr:uncharacterized protein LOC127087693 isoform X2 [Pisum sativum]KAI5402650.1 hypothetical protein KIW84_050302 [Pisum sativum]
MGEVSETTTTMTTTTKRKKKGRPSLLDLQKRSLKQQQKHLQNPNPFSNSNSNSNSIDEDERKLKKQKLLQAFNSHLQNPPALFPQSNSDPLSHPNGSDQYDGKVRKATDSKHGSQVVSGPTTPLPDKKLLLFILDRLQKKDTHGVFSEPVDPEELPDYHDIVKHPMDFGTIRKKLDEGLYISFEQFENDVFLVCSNAMQYNSSDTIYYRQARAMQEIAKKDFENLRQDSDDEDDDDGDSEPPPPKIVQRGRPPGKQTRKSLGMSPSELVVPESCSDATLASAGDIASGSNGYNLRKVVSKFQPTDASARAFHNNSGGYTNLTSEWENEFPASVVKAVLRYGKKQFTVDETRRDTYRNPVPVGNEPPVVTAFEDNFKQLLSVGLHVKHSYARSLANFAADLGPVAWKVAARKISSVLPPGHEFGPGWVSDDDVSQRQHSAVRDERNSDTPVQEDYRSRFSSPSRMFSLANASPLQNGDMVINREFSYQNEMNPSSSVSGGNESMIHGMIQQEPMAQSDDFGSNGRLGSNFSPQMKMVRLADITGSSNAGNAPQMLDMDTLHNLSGQTAPTNVNPTALKAQFFNKSSQSDSSNLSGLESGFESQRLPQGLTGNSSWQGSEASTKQQSSFSHANDLNGMIEATNSRSSNVETGPQLQPNLALQL